MIARIRRLWTGPWHLPVALVHHVILGAWLEPATTVLQGRGVVGHITPVSCNLVRKALHRSTQA